MNSLIVILGVVVVFLTYKLFLIYTSAPVMASNINLGIESQITPVKTDSITSPNKNSYTIGFWIYINTFSSEIGEFLAFGNGATAQSIISDFNGTTVKLPSNSKYLPQDIQKGTGLNNVCTFSMDKVAPTLYVNVSTSNSSTGNYNIESIPITTNLPIQTWTYVLVSISTNAGKYADCYINGKLLVSQQLTYTPYNSGSGTNNSSIKNTFLFPPPKKIDVYLTKISWIPQPIDPQTAWQYYNQGSGNPTGNGTMSKYGLEVDFTKDGNVTTWTIF